MQEQIKKLKVDQSIKLNRSVDEIRPIARNCRGRFRVIKESSTTCIVIRIDDNEISLRQQIIDAIDSMGVFDAKRINGDVQYIRSIVSRFNNEHGREVKVNKINGVATLSENVMARKSITPYEFQEIKDDFNQKLDLLRERMQ